MRELRRTFAKGLFVCLVVVVQLGVIVAELNDGHSRPEGKAERWLTAVGDTGRDGVREDAEERADEIGPLSLAAELVEGAERDGDHALFTDLEVGKATPAEGAVRVPFRVRPREGESVDGTLVLGRGEDGDWQIQGLDPQRRDDERLPSEGGSPPSSAPWALWALAVVIGLGITAFASLLVTWAGRPPLSVTPR